MGMHTFHIGALGVTLGCIIFAGSAFAGATVDIDPDLKVSFPETWKVVEQKTETRRNNRPRPTASVPILSRFF